MSTPKIPQRLAVFNHLKTHGYITDVVAQSYGIRRLASRIDELKKLGFVIDAELRHDDLGRRYAYYTLSSLTGCSLDGFCAMCEDMVRGVPPNARARTRAA